MKLSSLHNKGFAHIYIVLIVVVMAIGGTGYLVFAKQSDTQKPTQAATKQTESTAAKAASTAPAAQTTTPATTAPAASPAQSTSSAPKAAQPAPKQAAPASAPPAVASYSVGALRMIPSVNKYGGCHITFEVTVTNTGTAAGAVAITHDAISVDSPLHGETGWVIAVNAGETKTQTQATTFPNPTFVTAYIKVKQITVGTLLKEETASFNCP